MNSCNNLNAQRGTIGCIVKRADTISKHVNYSQQLHLVNCLLNIGGRERKVGCTLALRTCSYDSERKI